MALDAKTGKILWKRLLPSRSESSPLFDGDRVYFGSENGTVYNVRAGDGAVRWTFKASGRGQGRARAGQRQALLRRLQRARLRDPPGRRASGLGHGHQGRALRPELRPVLLDARGRLRARLHRQHRRPHVLVRLRQRQARVDQGHRLLRVRLPRRRAGAGQQADRLLRRLQRRVLRARRPVREGPLDAPRRRQDLRRSDRRRRHRLLLEPRQEGHDRPGRADRPRGLPHGPRVASTP